MTYSTKIKDGYRRLNSLYLNSEVIRGECIILGTKISVFVSSKPGHSAEGTLSAAGALSGMVKIYRWLNLETDDIVRFEVLAANQIIITEVQKHDAPSSTPTGQIAAPLPAIEDAGPENESVFRRQRLRPIHIELFSPENLNRWEPENEPDVYMAFGVLQEYTKFRYCCATSKQLLDRLGFNAVTKPDAILVDSETGEYLIAEFKMSSTAFALNHSAADVDVLIVWSDDAIDRSNLPAVVLSLREIARTAAQELIRG